MHHHAKVSYDSEQKRWAAACDCTTLWYACRWRDAFNSAFTHVRGERRIQSLGGIGFNKPIGRG